MPARRAIASLELSIDDPMQLFNYMDPAPFHERDLDSDVIDYVVDWAQDIAPDALLQLVVTVHSEAPPESGDALICDAVRTSFRRLAQAKQRALSRLLREGRISLVIAIAFLAVAIFISDYVAGLITNKDYALLLRESVVIGGWVALWHPLNIFLYEWWPIRAERRLFDRLGEMQVQVVDSDNGVAAK